MRFHVSAKDLKVRRCVASSPERCTAVGPLCSRHFDDRQDAQKAADGAMAALAVPRRRRSVAKRLLAAGGVLAFTFSMTACGAVDTDEQASWKQFEQQRTQQRHEDAKQEVSEAWQAAKDKVADSLPEGAQPGSPRGSTDVDGVFFQGGPLVPDAAEVSRAREALGRLQVAPEGQAGKYRGKDSQWKFDKDTYSRVELRDVTYNASFDDDGRAEDGSRFTDPYTGRAVTIIKGDSNDADIDHIVPKKEIKESQDPGAPFTREQERQITNDLDNLQLVSSSENRRKGDKDPADYLPANRGSVCVYAVRFIEVKAAVAPDGTPKPRPALTVDPAEKQALEGALETCGS